MLEDEGRGMRVRKKWSLLAVSRGGQGMFGGAFAKFVGVCVCVY